MLVSYCAPVGTDVLYKEQKVVAHKYMEGKEFFVQFYDGSVVRVDRELWQTTQRNETLNLVYKRKKK